MSTVNDWVRWAKANRSTVEIKISTSDGKLDRASIWIWSKKHMSGLSVPIDTEPANLPELIQRKAREKIEGADGAALREKREGNKLLAWAAENRQGKEVPAR
mgnify:CR=1 FL=1